MKGTLAMRLDPALDQILDAGSIGFGFLIALIVCGFFLQLTALAATLALFFTKRRQKQLALTGEMQAYLDEPSVPVSETHGPYR